MASMFPAMELANLKTNTTLASVSQLISILPQMQCQLDGVVNSLHGLEVGVKGIIFFFAYKSSVAGAEFRSAWGGHLGLYIYSLLTVA